MHVEEFFFHGTHKLKFKLPDEIAEEDMEKLGLETFMMCEHFRDETLSVFNTLKCFIGGMGLHGKIPITEPKVPDYMYKANLEFLDWAANI